MSFFRFFKLIIFIYLFSFFALLDCSWSGLFVYFDSLMFVILLFMSLFIISLVCLIEKSFLLIVLSELLLFIRILFFFSINIIILYVFFELSLFPVLVMVLGFGNQIEKVNSGYYLIFYVSFCSFPFIFVYFLSDIYFIICYFDFFLSWEIMFLLSLSFLVKFPVYLFHLWLPKVHVESPTVGSMLLAGLLLKLGTVGFIRILGSLMFNYVYLYVLLSLMGIIFSSISCMFQRDFKSLAAYSSVSHISFILISMVFFCVFSKTGSLILIISHGYTSVLIFYIIGEFFHIALSRIIYYLYGCMRSCMLLSYFMAFVFLSNRGIPPSLSFMFEFISVSLGFTVFNMMLFLLFIYFVLSFYYSMFVLVSSFLGSIFYDFNVWNIGYMIPFILMIYNIFWVGLF